ncbi:Stf0 family sulfotransferase [Chelativorans intermedius]|uniref:Stf0 family sulfotransferase n=1 Tax=Chelativorans intermedius TaxID=515947 RepID=A0ABV6D4Z9_9HYPH|nr:Stf0 family sulfotransferase [Chelativorans intermedius]MCT8999052.1 Stf0 family sulfotransferase [Chelativorans intermedius]
MDGQARKGYIVLSEARSGTNWLGSLADKTGRMGRLGEALNPTLFRQRPPEDGQRFVTWAVDNTSTPNGCFAIKIFPSHLDWFQARYGFDFIAECQRRHAVKTVLLKRRDRLAQAISLYRASETARWRSVETGRKQEAEYSFEGICRAYFQIDRSNAFWKSYLEVRGISHSVFFYEDLLGDPSPYLEAVAAHLQVAPPEDHQSPLAVQRDARTAAWAERFRREAHSRDVLNAGSPPRPVARTLPNLWRFLRKRPIPA